MLLTDSVPPPEFVTVKVVVPEEPLSTVPALTVVADSEMAGGGSCPVPFTIRFTVPASGSLLETVSVEYFVPAELGVNVTVTFWLAPAFTLKFVGEIVN